MNTIGNNKIPKHVTDQNTLEILIENMKKRDTEQQQTEPQNMIFILKLVMSFLLWVQEESNKYFNSIKFIYEQLNKKLKGYKLLRDSKILILPNYSIIKRQILSTRMNPLNEQHDKNFIPYIKNKFKFLVQMDHSIFTCWLVSLFKDISTFIGYLIPKPFS